MTKTTKIILIILTFFILLSLGLFVFYSYIIKSENQIDNFEEFTDTYIFGRPKSDVTGGDRFDLSTTSQEIIGLDENVTIPKLRKISSTPVSGFISFEDDKGVVSVRYTERSTGHIYEAKTDSITKKRVSNTTIPRVQESIWVDKDSTIIRYLDENDNIKSFYAKIIVNNKDSLIDGKTEGVFLVNNMKEVIPIGNRLFYLLEDNNGSEGFTTNLKGGEISRIFNSPIKEWLVQRPKKGFLTLTTKPSSEVFGYLFFLNINKERMDKKLVGRGLTTLTNKNISSILFSTSFKNSFSLGIYNSAEGNIKIMSEETLPEKCVWGGNDKDIYCGIPKFVEKGKYPDEWYQGVISFSDNIFKLNLETDLFELIASPKDMVGEDIDIIKPALSTDEDYLFFINKKDLTLWSLELE